MHEPLRTNLIDGRTDSGRPSPMALFRRRPSTRPLIPAPPGEGVELPVTHEELVVLKRPNGQIAEQFRRLRNSLQALNPDGAARAILMTSAITGEGKTVATLNLAMALAELPSVRVLVLDGDTVDPSVEELLGQPRRQGLTEVLQGRLALEQAVRQTGVERLDIIGPGEPPPNPAELLNIDRLRAVLNNLKRGYDYVLIDAPAVLTMNHPSVMGTIADGILLVVRMNKTSKHLVEEAYNLLENLGGNVLGTCVTGSHDPEQG